MMTKHKIASDSIIKDVQIKQEIALPEPKPFDSLANVQLVL